MERQFSQALGVGLTVLTVAGFAMSGRKKHALNMMNVDSTHSMLRIPLTLALLYAATKSDLKTTRRILLGVGVFYIGMGTAGIVHRKVGGLLPSGLTTFDIAYHFTVGVAATWLGARSGRMLKP